MSDITTADVEHLASLARIDLTQDELAGFASQLVDIQHLIAKVQEVATPEVTATSHPIVMPNVTRPDVVGETLTPEEALSGAPDDDGTRFRVTAILGEEQ
ncbi:Asp-tRNA(Asn)/Glu-tRNA(Gln) amidotransferase subunit GatC [Pseudoclavibacter alba]|uniref:Aspartyl/glutamyl-tRNA(Asn/Gln) amidotransferase subunit C n=1 Tax=Pseudoclavibacter albus TaxID=272241 RepID=A0ABT2HWM2_9MICO|nr:Asp-tRNA(Asn)/Glu-tRNA(Gln) amidotransferase subunit GatC [Pseudoclavibacter alba]MBN6778105.1 Asp-tRNA(Asn)/Glu-tRNA(Gln) amidotransferase subunit GatC [Pseudoclavibacter alba]MCT2042540.1 Asp-tRNA(Asn)/Glu-tRNA(Gln) amidotransferase subunit GatC [Pseudoclavibacter alba]